MAELAKPRTKKREKVAVVEQPQEVAAVIETKETGYVELKDALKLGFVEQQALVEIAPPAVVVLDEDAAPVVVGSLEFSPLTAEEAAELRTRFQTEGALSLLLGALSIAATTIVGANLSAAAGTLTAREKGIVATAAVAIFSLLVNFILSMVMTSGEATSAGKPTWPRLAMGKLAVGSLAMASSLATAVLAATEGATTAAEANSLILLSCATGVVTAPALFIFLLLEGTAILKKTKKSSGFF